jgi:hypothetical protein
MVNPGPISLSHELGSYNNDHDEFTTGETPVNEQRQVQGEVIFVQDEA